MASLANSSKRAPKYYRIGTPGCPPPGSDAGDATAFLLKERLRRISRMRADVRRAFASAQRQHLSALPTAEERARAALHVGAQLYWLTERLAWAEQEHRRLHTMGRWVRRTFGCRLDFDQGQYKTCCPVKISDKRIGLSPGFIAKRCCSICDDDLSECPHVRDRLYWVTGGAHNGKACAVCRESDCSHRSGRLYRAAVYGIIKKIDELLEVSFVNVPANPFARLTELPIDSESLQRNLGPDFRHGMPVNCDHCLEGYHGLPARPDLD